MDDAAKLAVWEKGIIAEGFDQNIWRRDVFGHPIKFDNYGDRDSKYGWEVHHIIFVASGGSDDLSNLIPLQWEENAKNQPQS